MLYGVVRWMMVAGRSAVGWFVWMPTCEWYGLGTSLRVQTFYPLHPK